MPKALARQVQQRYPVTVLDLSKTDLKLLIEVLRVENPAIFQKIYNIDGKCVEKPNQNLQQVIKNLPPHLRNKFMTHLVPNAFIRTANLCASHRGLNPYVINHTFQLVKGEVTAQLGIFNWYSNRLEQEIENLVNALHAIEGMWWVPSTKSEIPPNGASPYQENRCEACILARIFKEPMHLQNLRTTLLSRTRTRQNHRAPKLLSFIDVGIMVYPNAFQLFNSSSEVAFRMKTTRKAAVRERKSKAQRDKVAEGHVDENEDESQSIFICLDPRMIEEGSPRPDELPNGRNVPSKCGSSAAAAGAHGVNGSIGDSQFPKYSDEFAQGEVLPSTKYIPPREEPDWEDITPRHGPFDSLIKDIDDFVCEISPLSGSSGYNGEIERPKNPLAKQMDALSNCEYNPMEWEDDSIGDSESGATTWSIVCPPGHYRR